MIPKHIQKLADEGKIKIASDQESLNSAAQLVLSGVANQIDDGNVKVSDIVYKNMGDNEKEHFVFATFEFLK